MALQFYPRQVNSVHERSPNYRTNYSSIGLFAKTSDSDLVVALMPLKIDRYSMFYVN
jgi:hypothetical protein